MSALSKLRVIELAESAAGEYCGKLLADFGAEVIKIELPGSGSPTRASYPIISGKDEVKVSALFSYLNTNKESLALDLSFEPDKGHLSKLLAEADVVIDDHSAIWRDRSGIDSSTLQQQFPSLIFAVISPYGQNADPAQWQLKSNHVFHSSGWGYHTPSAPAEDSYPLNGPRYLPDYEAGLEAALCIVSSHFSQQNSQYAKECFIDVSQRDVLISRADLVLGRMLLGVDEPGKKRTAYDQPGPAAFFPCADGAVYLYVTNQKHWRGLQELMGQPAWMKDYDKDWLEFGVTMELVANFRKRFGEWVRDKEKFEVSSSAQEIGVPLVPVNDAGDIFESPQYQYRQFFQPLEHPALGTVEFPTVPYKFSKTPVQLTKAAPDIGSVHDPAFSPRKKRTYVGEGTVAKPGRVGPLAGVRVVEIAKVWAGPYAGKLLGMLGAEVIKIESHTNLDELRAFGGVDIDHAPFYLSVNQEVLSAQVNLKTEEGIECVKRLIAESDIVIDNLRPGAMEKLGLDYQNLQQVKQDIIAVSIKMFGNEGPLGAQTGYAPCFTALSGLSDLVGYDAEHPAGINMRYGDATVGANAAFAALVALTHRQATGEGQFVDLSAVECMSVLVGESLLEYTLTGDIPRAKGNSHPEMTPHSCYPCLDGEWISLAVATDQEWLSLCRVLEDSELSENSRFNTMAMRQEHAVELDNKLASITKQFNASTLEASLMAEGVGAVKSQSTLDLMANQQLWERGVFRTVYDENNNSRPVVGVGWNISGIPTAIRQGAPLLGQHNDYVYSDILGLSTEEIKDLVSRQVIY